MGSDGHKGEETLNHMDFEELQEHQQWLTDVRWWKSLKEVFRAAGRR